MTSVLWIAGAVVGWAIIGVPLLRFAVASVRKIPERARTRAVPWAAAIGGWTGIVIGLSGFVWGAGVPDENAGAAAVLLFNVGCVAGIPVGGLGSYVFITRRAQALSSQG